MVNNLHVPNYTERIQTNCTICILFWRTLLANTLRIIGKHNHIWQTSIRGIFARCSFFTCKLGLQRILIVNSLRIFCEYVANIHLNMLIKYAANILRIFCEYSANILIKRKNRCCDYVANNNCEYPANKQRLCCE